MFHSSGLHESALGFGAQGFGLFVEIYRSALVPLQSEKHFGRYTPGYEGKGAMIIDMQAGDCRLRVLGFGA